MSLGFLFPESKALSCLHLGRPVLARTGQGRHR